MLESILEMLIGSSLFFGGFHYHDMDYGLENGVMVYLDGNGNLGYGSPFDTSEHKEHLGGK